MHQDIQEERLMISSDHFFYFVKNKLSYQLVNTWILLIYFQALFP